MPTQSEQLEAAIHHLEQQRGLLGDAVVDAAIAPLHEKLAALNGAQTLDRQALKQVTVLFLDVVGSTQLAGKLDAEETYAVMHGALTRFTGVATAHGGKVMGYAGDSMLVAFGAEESREDDAERAVRCGLALAQSARDYAAMMEHERGHTGFAVRVGVHTGGVLLGGGVDGEASIRGNAVNIAARMEQSAPPGGVRISHDSYTQVRGVFEVEPQAPMSVKGVDEALTTYLVLRLKPRAFRVRTRGIEGVETRMIGRDAELEALQDAFREVLGERHCVCVTIVGEAGIGKSRLLYELDQWAETHPQAFYHFEGRATPQTEGQPYGLVRDIVFRRLQIDDADAPAAAKNKLECELIPLFAPIDGQELAEAQVHVLGHLIGLDYSASPHVTGIVDDGRQIRNRGFLAAARMIRQLAERDATPVVMALDDLHWADDPSLDFALYLAEVSTDVPLLLLALARPTLYERRPDWHEADQRHRRIDLAALDRGASRVLANELLKKLPEVPQALRELVTAGAEGNPFYMEELVRVLVDQGAIDTKGERWTLHPERLLKIELPATLTGVVQARLDGLAAAERSALQHASVIGMVFWDQALAALDPAAPEVLPSLVARELIVPKAQGSLEGMREYAFSHQILHQVTYDTLLKRMRKALHAKVADWLAHVAGSTAADLLAIAAGHYEEAGEVLRSCEFYAAAAEHALSRHAHTANDRYTAHALALLDEAKLDALDLRGRLLESRIGALRALGLEAEEQEALDQLLANAMARHDIAAQARALYVSAAALSRRGKHGEAIGAARRALELAHECDDAGARLMAIPALASALFMTGEPREAEDMLLAALDEATRLGHVVAEATLRNRQAVIYGAQDRIVETLSASRRHADVMRSLGDRLNEATANANIGLNLIDLGEYDEARRYLEEALRVSRVVGPRDIESSALYLLATVLLSEGNEVQALALAKSSLDIARLVKMPQRIFTAHFVIADAELALGRLDDAMRSFELAEAAAVATNCRLDCLAGQARVALARNDPSDALRRMEPAVDHVIAGRSLVNVEVPRLMLWTCYRALEAKADARADSLLDIAYANLQERATSISDAHYRNTFLENVAEHRAMAQAWRARQDKRSGAPGGLHA